MGDKHSNVPTNLQFLGIPQITLDNHVETLHAIVLGSKLKLGQKCPQVQHRNRTIGILGLIFRFNSFLLHQRVFKNLI